ncbi:hypothetical protein ABIB40_000112 [Pedobacter sp. UYP30]|uniref:C40 family peptidase n=1 Tax=Pedobacter sp. UYP30 TaxID=1756400 RepID=UPI003394BBB2
MENTYGICRVAVAPLRAEPTDRAEMVTQLLFGEHVEILEKQERWWLIQNGYDRYQGWIDPKQLVGISGSDFTTMHNCNMLAPLSFDNSLTSTDGSVYHICPGSNLPNIADGYCQLAKERFKLGFQPHQKNTANFKDEVAAAAKFFHNIPYLWGGRNLFGLDCSGFVQLVFKMFDIALNRDASQQAEQGDLVGFLAEGKAGDVAFFDNEEGKITHVGILLSPNEIIHASSKVRIDLIDDQGIFNKELGRYTHKLRIIKRFVE